MYTYIPICPHSWASLPPSLSHKASKSSQSIICSLVFNEFGPPHSLVNRSYLHLCLQFCVLYFTQHQSNFFCEFQKQKQILCSKFPSFSSSGSLPHPPPGFVCTLYPIVAVPSGTVLSCFMLHNAENAFSHNLELLAEQKETNNSISKP